MSSTAGDHGGPIVIRDEAVHRGPGARALSWFAKKLRRWAIMLLHSPFGLASFALIAAGVWTWFYLAQVFVYVAAALLIGGAGVWQKRSPGSFHRHVRMRARGLWRGWWVYRRKWGRVMRSATITHVKGSQLPIPLGVHSTEWVDEIEFRLMDGQRAGDYIPNADRINTTIKGVSTTIERVPNHSDRLRIYVLARDPLAREIPPLPKPTIDDLLPRAGVNVAITDHGLPLALKILGQNTFIPGYSGAGKSGWLWSIVNALHPAMEHSIVRLLGLDPKLQELRMGAHLFYHLVKPKSDRDIQRYWHDCYDMFKDRQERVGDRFLDPTPAEPLYVMVVDEWGALKWISDSKIRRDVENVTKLILSQARACAFSVIAAMQDPKKESLPQRDLFQNVVGLRLPYGLIDMVMGNDAWLKGAKLDLIPPMLEGVAYVKQAKQPDQFTRCRAGFLNDEAILDLDPTTPITIPQPRPEIEFGHLPQWGGFGYR